METPEPLCPLRAQKCASNAVLKWRPAATDRTEVLALACTECGRTCDPRIDFCPTCGAETAIEDPAQPIAPGSYHFDTALPGAAAVGTLDRARERMIALRQQQALLEGHEPASAQVLGAEFDAEMQMRHVDLQARGAEIMQGSFAHGPGTSGRWEANPFGLSGRLVRGYRHWRHKR